MNSAGRNPHLLNDPSGGGDGGRGCLIGSNNNASTTGALHGYGSPPGTMVDMGGGSGGVGPCQIPTPSWIKPPSNSGMITPESDVSSCSSPAAAATSNYGATSQQQQQQQRTFYGSANYNGNPISSSTNNNGMFYDANGDIAVGAVDQNQYYQQQQPRHQHNPHEGGNFYGFYNPNANQSGHYADYHQHHHHQQHHEGYSSGGNNTGDQQAGDRMHHQQQYFRQDDSNSSTNVPVGHSNYYSSPVGTPNPNYPSSSGTPPARYGSPMMFPNNQNNYSQQHPPHHHQQGMQSQIPLRRNSIESYSSEPGDSMHSSYAARFNCGSNNGNTMNNNINQQQQLNHHQQQQQQQQHHNSFAASGMVKRDCNAMSNRVSPSMTTIQPNMNTSGCWSPHPATPGSVGAGYYPASSPNSGGCSSSSSPNLCTNNTNNGGGGGSVNRTAYMNHSSTYNQHNVCGESGVPNNNCGNVGNNFYNVAHHHHSQQQVPSQFKSCVYEQSQEGIHDIKDGIQAMIDTGSAGNTNNMKAASAIKHRSLSLSMPLPSYMEHHHNSGSGTDMESNFINQSHHHRQLPHPHHSHNPQQIHNNHAFNQMMNTSPHNQHHHHQQCASTTGLIPPPEQNLLTPNSDDDIAASSACGQSDLDSSYETMGEEGCSSTSPHCTGVVDTSNHCGTSITIANTTTDHLHSLPVDCHHNHHHSHSHNHHQEHQQLAFPSVASCMQSHHHQQQQVASTMGMTMMEIPNSTVALCTTNVGDDLDDSSSDSSSVELHNVISAVVEQSSIETPENTMMGDEMDFHQNQDSLTNVNIISTTTNEPEDDEDDDIVTCNNGNEVDDDDEEGDCDDDDNCSESSMSHINSSFTADMFCNNSSNSIMSSVTDNNPTSNTNHLNHHQQNNNNNNINASDKAGTGSDNDMLINSSCGNNDFPSNSLPDTHFTNSLNPFAFTRKPPFSTSSNLLLPGLPSLQSQQLLLSKSSSFSPPPQPVSSPQKISKRSFSDADKESITMSKIFSNHRGSTITEESISLPSATSTNSSSSTSSTTVVHTSLVSFGASFRKSSNGNNNGNSEIGCGESSVKIEKAGEDDDKEDSTLEICENSAIIINDDNSNIVNDSCESSGNKNSDKNDTSNNNNTGEMSGCKAIDIIISSTKTSGSLMSLDKKGHMVSIPKGWKREILKGSSNDNGSSGGSGIPNSGNGVLYISPSDTKIRNFDELKNYIGSDGTCKCGLSCPLRLEIAFSFDPKVTNMTAEDEKENLEAVNTSTAISGGSGCTNGGKNGTSSLSSSTSSSTTTSTLSSSSSVAATTTKSNAAATSGTESDSSRLLCNHKRKIPKAEDSPLISSTRDDLGDFGEKLKKRRLSGNNECSGEKLVTSGPFRKDPITTSVANSSSLIGGVGGNNKSSTIGNSITSKNTASSNNNASQNVPVPFCQQSPDTTTQTPQTEMSPASSVCSDSSTILFSTVNGGSSGGGNRSLTSTPTPTLSSSSTSSSSGVSSAAATSPAVIATTVNPTTKFGSSPSQGQGHCEFVWPSPPQQATGIASLSPIILPQPLINQSQTNPIWINSSGSLATFSPITPILGNNANNSLTLNYVQPPNMNNAATAIIANSSTGKGPITSGSVTTGIIQPSTTSTTASTLSPPVSTTSTTQQTGPTPTPVKKLSNIYPSKTIKRSSSPCPNVDVRQLPLEKNRPPPPVPSTTQHSNSNKITPTVSFATSPVVSAPASLASPITSLSTLPIVTNPNILFTVTPPLMTANKTEIVNLAAPSLPILPLLTTTGKLPSVGPIDTSCGAPTILTTLHPNTSLFSTIDGNSLYPAASTASLQSKEPLPSSIIQSIPTSITTTTTTASQQPTTTLAKATSPISNSGNRIEPKKKSQEPKNETEANKIQGKGKDGKASKVPSSSNNSGNNNGGDKSPLQLAQDIINRFEKKPGEKNGSSGGISTGGENKSNENKSSSNIISTSTSSLSSSSSSSKEVKVVEIKEKVKEIKASPKVVTKSNKVTTNKAPTVAVGEKSNNNEAKPAAATKIDSSSSQSKPDTVKPAGVKGTNPLSSSPDTNKTSAVSSAFESKTESFQSKQLDKTPTDPSSVKQQQPLQQLHHPHPIILPPSSSNITTTTTLANQLPLNTVVAGTTQLPPPQQQQHASVNPLENTIITSQTSVVSTPSLILKDGGLQFATTDQGLTLTTSVSAPIPTISLSSLGNQIIQTSSGAPVPCSNTITAGGLSGLSTAAFGPAGTNQIILQSPSAATQDSGNGANSTFLTTSASAQGATNLRYPILQTIQPFFLNSAGPAGGPLIISQPTQSTHDSIQSHHTLAQPSFIYDQNGTPTATFDTSGVGAFQSMLQPATTTMVLDPSTLCGGNPNLSSMVGGGAKKKKKRLSKKQQQQQAQLQLQQQLILQQIQAQQQQAAAAAIAPLTIFPQSFNLGPQGFSLQPTMNFFPTPTILTLPNLILNPADGTLFIQPSTPLQTATTTPMQLGQKLGQFPLTTTTTIPQNPQNIAPKKDGSSPTIIQNMNEPLKPSSTPGLDPGSDDSRQNPTPDSSTNDLQLGLINVAAATGATPASNTITLNISAPTTTTVLHNPNPLMSKKNSKSRTVSSSSTNVKRILPQKQILPKIDSTTPSTTENAN